jgi:dTDP-4-amino-4,6-dideoxygalactose transaminase
MNVPFLDLAAQYKAIGEEIQEKLSKVFQSCVFSGGPFVEEFETGFARYCDNAHVAAVSNGTSALWLALLALGVKQGDEVITVPNSFIATAEAISYAGAKPVFIDVDPVTYTMDPRLIEKAITTKTRAIIPVHLFGQPADMDPIMEIARKHKLFVVEDACQAHGAEYKGKKAGTIGDLGAFSFYPGKNLGAYGEAGAVTSTNKEYIDFIKKFRDHGQYKKYYHDYIGWNDRMDGIQGAVLSVKLKYLQTWTEQRREHAEYYRSLLQEEKDKIQLPLEAKYAKHVYHIFAIQTGQRDQLITHLKNEGINCGIHYPVPIHLQQAYAHQNCKAGSFPVVEESAARFVSLPMYAELTNEQIEYTVDKIKNFIHARG